MRRRILLAALLAFGSIPLPATPASAQLAPDTPRLVSPNGPGGLGVYWLRAATLPEDGDGILVTWAPAALPDGVRLRAGGGTGANGDMAGFGGIDAQTPLIRDATTLPVDLDWYTGIGFAAGSYLLVTVPAGISGSVSWSSGSIWMAPYVSAGLAADLRIGESAPGEEFEVHPAVDIGFDLSLDAARSFVLRAAASLGDRQTLAAGIVLGGGERALRRR